MVLMIDANVLLDHILRRTPFDEPSRRICLLGIAGEAETCISTNMLTDVFYILKKAHGSRKAQRMLAEDLSFLKLVSVTPEDAQRALAEAWPDFEDCLVSQCAQKARADYIITRNEKDFRQSPVEAISPEGFFGRMAAKGIAYDEISLL